MSMNPWHPATEPPSDTRKITIRLADGREVRGHYNPWTLAYYDRKMRVQPTKWREIAK